MKPKELVQKHVFALMPDDIKTLRQAVNLDLHFGPHSKQDFAEEGVDWPGYSSACSKLQEWIDSDMPSELWCDVDCEDCFTREPQGYTDDETGEWVEPFLENTYHFERRDILRAVFGEIVGNGVS